MTFLVRHIVVLVCLCTISSVLQTVPAKAAAAGSIQAAVVYLEVTSAAGAKTPATGFLVHPDGYVLTNKHAVRGAIGIVAHVGERLAPALSVPLDSVISDPDQDLALVRISGGGSQFAILDLAASGFVPDLNSPEGRDIMVAGFPQEHAYSPTFGKLVNLNDPHTHRRWVTDVAASHGSSGSPVIHTESGVVIGVFTTIDNAVVGFGTMEPISFAEDLLRKIPNWPPPTNSLGTGRVLPIATTGGSRVRVHGDGGGTLRPDDQVTTWSEAPFNGFAIMEGRGDEKSECDEEFGRRRSAAFARASVHGDGALGLIFNLHLTSNGGHYRRAAVSCLNNRIPNGSPKRFLLGTHPKDTRAVAEGRLEGVIIFSVNAAGRTIAVTWGDLPQQVSHASIRLVKLDGSVLREWNNPSEAGVEAVKLSDRGTYRLEVRLEASARDEGSCCAKYIVRAARVNLLQ